MENEQIKRGDVAVILSDKRYDLGRSEVTKILTELRNDELIDDSDFERILEEDLDLEIKYKTFKKCINQIFAGLMLTSLGLILGSLFPLCHLLTLIGIIVTISSVFGLRPNKLSKKQIGYLKQ